jgi:hypothetical protein
MLDFSNYLLHFFEKNDVRPRITVSLSIRKHTSRPNNRRRSSGMNCPAKNTNYLSRTLWRTGNYCRMPADSLCCHFVILEKK